MNLLILIQIIILIDLFFNINCDVHHILKSSDSYHRSSGYSYEPNLPSIPDQPIQPVIPLLPEIIINRKNTNYNNYIPPAADEPYLPPLQNFPQPPFNEETTHNPSIDKPPNGYIPPNDHPETILPQSDEIYPFDDPVSGYVYPQPPVNAEHPVQSYLPPNPEGRILKMDANNFLKQSPLRLDVNELRCLPNPNGYFRGTITMHNRFENVPVFDIDVQDQRCDIRLLRSQVVVSVNADDFHRCGVHSCPAGSRSAAINGNGRSIQLDLCMRIRFPLIDGMKTLNDPLLTLQCKLQERVVAKTHALKLGITNAVQGRSASGILAQGGNQQPFRTQLGIYRKADGAFSRFIEPGGIVQLGEELLLRVQVRAGDGWNHTRVSDVQLQRLSPTGDILSTANLINSNGCVNPAMRLVCPNGAVFEPPLGHRILFRAIMFQGMHSGDEMQMSVRIVGCIDHIDCYVDKQLCERSINQPIGRRRRDTNKTSINNSSVDLSEEISTISFRVEMPESLRDELSRVKTDENYYINTYGFLGLVATLSFIGLILLLGFYINHRK